MPRTSYLLMGSSIPVARPGAGRGTDNAPQYPEQRLPLAVMSLTGPVR
jgi:hypothetical protein